jgi:hypothetical protein
LEDLQIPELLEQVEEKNDIEENDHVEQSFFFIFDFS